MKMADTEKTEEFVDAENLPESAADVRGEQREPLRLETTTTSSPPGEKEGDSPLQTEGEPSLLSMPCLMKELRRDSPESQHASPSSDKPPSGHVYESDSSNPCMLSPSSSGHLADSDTLSSGEDGAGSRAAGGSKEAGADAGSATGGQTPASSGRKSRRSRSESEMSTNTMAAKKNRCQPSVTGGASSEKQTNGRLAKVKGHRSQKHKERIRLLRQKREAAARKKYNLLQDSSTSDSDLTCDSSTSSSEDQDETSGGKTITTDIPGHMEAELTHREPLQHKGHIQIPSSDSEVEIVGVQENTSRCGGGVIQSHPRGGVIQSLPSAWKPNSVEQFNNSTRQSSQMWTTVSQAANWVSPPEVVDLTLDDDTRHKYLL